ncbi:MAG: ABC transporter ATP-binding protein [Clostridia bacterium]|nr:ABC transporter ATP-binding protein [Clostridia bacterium]
MTQIECKNLSIGYDNAVVCENMNFKVERGDYFAIVGENGAGKSTLMKTLLGLIRPISGEIVIGDGLKRKEIGYLPQQTAAQKDFPASVCEVVLSGFLAATGLRPFYSKEEKAKAKSNIEKMGLSGFEKRCYRELSGGQQQRVLLARALCATKKIMLLDEPVSGLDPKVAAETYDIVEKLNREGTTIITVTHDLGSAIKYANKILHIGSEIFYGSKYDYMMSNIGKNFIYHGENRNV